ncbi:MAG: D-alanyl-D-alanine carboxypeptidase/D-alanyl-D-alanine endopeptidase [Pyrinomonadaceae bacterium]
MSHTPKLRAQLLLRSALGVLLLILGVVVFRSLISGRPNPEHAPQHAQEQLTRSAFEATKDSKQAPESLAQRIDRAIDKSEFASARWGVSVISLNSGSTIYARNADRLFTPASNMKIYTTAVALDLLGAGYQWRTSVYANARPDSAGTIASDLVLYGRGAPDLVTQPKKDDAGSLAQLADELYNRGVRKVTGNVIGDESYFRGESLGDGWQWTDIQWYFGAEASALSVNSNEVDVSVLPPDKAGAAPKVTVNPSDDYFSIDNSMAAAKRGERMTVGIQRGLSDNNIRVWGQFPRDSKGFGARLSVHNPALWAARLFRAVLKAKGIEITGIAQARDARKPVSQRFDPSGAVELAFLLSKPLSEVVKATNKASINLNAELILRTLGRERGTMTSAPEPPGRERGDDEAGLAVIRLWLSRAGISTNGLALHDGSGLSRLNLVTPQSISQLLLSVSKTASGPAFRQSLPISGRDGTLGSRLSKISDQVWAKTGSLTYDTSLSGYVNAANGEVLVFSIICNDQTHHANATRVIDEIVSAVAAYPVFKG